MQIYDVYCILHVSRYYFYVQSMCVYLSINMFEIISEGIKGTRKTIFLDIFHVKSGHGMEKVISSIFQS